jgi:hypothetical protein
MIFEIVAALCIFFFGIPLAIGVCALTVGFVEEKWAEILAFFIVVPAVVVGGIAAATGIVFAGMFITGNL